MRDFSTDTRQRRARPWDAALLAAVAAVLVASTHAASAARADLGRARAAVADGSREAESLGTRARALESRGGVGEILAEQIALAAEAPPPRVLADVAALLPPDVRLDGLALSYGVRLRIEAKVVARGATAYDAFLKRLGESAVFEEVLMGPESREGEVQASVQMTYRGAPGP